MRNNPKYRNNNPSIDDSCYSSSSRVVVSTVPGSSLLTAMEELAQQWEEIQIQFRSNEEELALKRSEFTQKEKLIYEISGVQMPTENGEEDILKINFGGKIVDIKRSVLTKPKFGWSLFSCLFEKRWDNYHARDRKGRIYIDLKEEWMRPLLDYFKYKADTGDRILSSIYLNRTLKAIHAAQFCFPPVTVGDSFRSSIVSDIPEIERLLTSLKFESCALNLLFYTNLSFPAKQPPRVDMRYKTFLILIETTMELKKIAVVCRPDQRFSHLFGSKAKELFRSMPTLEYCFTEDLNLSSIFPIEFSRRGKTYLRINSPGGSSGALPSGTSDVKVLDCTNLEIYEIRTIPSNIYPVNSMEETLTLSTPEEREEGKEEQIEEDLPFGSPTENLLLKFTRAFHDRTAYYSEELRKIQLELLKQENETNFMSHYFSRSWLLPSSQLSTNSSSVDMLKLITITKTDMEGQRGVAINRKRKRAKEEESSIENSDSTSLLDPIVYFNVEGEIFPILRSTILNVIPDSQLAVRVSGRWKEQETDVDEEGNLIVNCHKEAFKHILSSVQVQNCFHGLETAPPLEIFVNDISRDAIEETLDFLLIKPASIRLLEVAF
jgi:hypothetical protein